MHRVDIHYLLPQYVTHLRLYRTLNVTHQQINKLTHDDWVVFPHQNYEINGEPRTSWLSLPQPIHVAFYNHVQLYEYVYLSYPLRFQWALVVFRHKNDVDGLLKAVDTTHHDDFLHVPLPLHQHARPTHQSQQLILSTIDFYCRKNFAIE